MRGSPVEVAGQTSLVVTLGAFVPLVILGFYSVPDWIEVSYVVVFSATLLFIVYRTDRLGFEIVKRSSKEDWELFIEGLAGYFVVGGVLLALYSVLEPQSRERFAFSLTEWRSIAQIA